MNNPTEPDATPDSFVDLPLQPTGSGVADLEIAYEQMKLAHGEEAAPVRAEGDVGNSHGSLDDVDARGQWHPS